MYAYLRKASNNLSGLNIDSLHKRCCYINAEIRNTVGYTLLFEEMCKTKVVNG